MSIETQLEQHQRRLKTCRRCKDMTGPPVTGNPVASQILLVGQAPGSHELIEQRPFAWTAGKTLFAWFSRIGVSETQFRTRVYMAAVCRCFPGKNPRGGDRKPNREEVDHCAGWLKAEIELLTPRIVLPVGKLAIEQFLPKGLLKDVIGRCHSAHYAGQTFDVLPLPHPSGASTWHVTHPGKTLLEQALHLLAQHPAWRNTFSDS